MTPYRATTIAAIIIIPTCLWGFVAQAKNDLVYHTRNVMGQWRKTSEEDPYAFNRFYIRLRYPEGHPETQLEGMARLFSRMRRGEVTDVSYGREFQVPNPLGNAPFKGREVKIARAGYEEPIIVNWVNVRGNWYLYSSDD